MLANAYKRSKMNAFTNDANVLPIHCQCLAIVLRMLRIFDNEARLVKLRSESASGLIVILTLQRETTML